MARYQFQQGELFGARSYVGGAGTVEIQRYLSGEDFPADNESLIRRAKQAGAPPEVLMTLDQLPSRRFEGLGELSIGLAQIH
jgi:hypothetical protein